MKILTKEHIEASQEWVGFCMDEELFRQVLESHKALRDLLRRLWFILPDTLYVKRLRPELYEAVVEAVGE